MPNYTFSPHWPDDQPLETFEKTPPWYNAEVIRYLLARLAYKEGKQQKIIDDAMANLAERVVKAETTLAAREREIAALQTGIRKLRRYTPSISYRPLGPSPYGNVTEHEMGDYVKYADLYSLLSPHLPAVENVCRNCRMFRFDTRCWDIKDKMGCDSFKPAVDRKED